MSLTRRALLGAAPFALAACGRQAEAVTFPAIPGGLKNYAPFPVGAAITSAGLADPAYATLVRTHFDQVTADWEMKMEAVLQEDGSLDWTRPDGVARFAQANGLRLFGHTLIWNEQRPEHFERLRDDRPAFEREYARYIGAVVGRYRGAAGWDVVNEPFNWDGSELRGGVWAEALGPDYIARAFRHAQAADPQAVLFLNDYNLEAFPAKRRGFLKLAETLLKANVPLGGLGTQTHLDPQSDPKAIGPALRELASLGLPLHLSELDVTLKGGGRNALAVQARLVGAAAEGFAGLPERQQFAFTTWGVRDRDSWRRQPEQAAEFPNDRPLLLDDDGRPKSAFAAAVEAWR